VIGERWTLLVLREVLLGRRRFQSSATPGSRRTSSPTG
jgi:hypothetical protein